MLWHDGQIVPDGKRPFDLSDRGLTLGDGVFDTALAIGGRVAFEDAHVARLAASAATLGFPVDPARIRDAMRALAATGPRLAIRTTITHGSGPRGLAAPPMPNPTLFAAAAASDPRVAFSPLRLWPTDIVRNETSPTSRLKTLGYLDAVFAMRTARQAGFDEAVFRNTRGAVACAGTGNIFAVFGNVLATPNLADGILDGVMRAAVREAAPSCGLSWQERSLMPIELDRSDAVFITNSLRMLAPVSVIGPVRYELGHPALDRLMTALRARVATECQVPEADIA